jgi:FMN phosphatase YigB (HAD superfamily)
MILSFDVWNTLLSANPEFKTARIDAIVSETGLPKIAVATKLRDTKRVLDFIQEDTGKAFTSLFCWKLFLKHVNYEGDIDEMGRTLLEISNTLFVRYPPSFDVELVKVIRKMKKGMSHIDEIVLVSNTNFVPGNLLWTTCFEHLDLFDSAFFSDQWGVGKPSEEAFARGWPLICGRKVIHVGDTIVTDGACTKYGAEFILVKDPSDTLKRLTEFTV